MRPLLLAALIAFAPGFAAADVWTFGTPSGNIECSVGEERNSSDIICDIFRRTATMPGFAQCPANRGLRVSMLHRGPVSAECLPASARPTGSQSVAEYGVQGRFGGFVCDSATTGLRCQNLDGRGFFLSRAVQQVF